MLFLREHNLKKEKRFIMRASHNVYEQEDS